MQCATCQFSFHPMLGVSPEDANRMLEEKRQAYRKQHEQRSQQEEDTAWNRACDLNTASSYQDYLANTNWGRYRAQAFARLRDTVPIDKPTNNNAHSNGQFDSRTYVQTPSSQSWNWQWLNATGRVLWQVMQWLARMSPGAFAIITQVVQFAYRMTVSIVGCILNIFRSIYRLLFNFLDSIENILRRSFIAFLIDFAYWGVGLFFSFGIAMLIVKTFIHLPDKMHSDWYLIFSGMIGLVFYALWLNAAWLNRYRFWLSALGVSILVLMIIN